MAALRSAATDIVEAELARVARRGDFTDDQRAEVARTVHRVVQRLLHEPTVRVRELAGQPGAPTTPKPSATCSRSNPTGSSGPRTPPSPKP
ncbi:hypothetical protein GCM10029992_18920 [Glycomyces albus]